MGLLIKLGCVQGLHSFNLASGNVLMSLSGYFNLASGGLLWNEECYIFYLGDFSSIKSSKILLCVSLEMEQDPAPRLHYCFLSAPPLSLHPLPSLISNYLNLPFGTQGRSWRLNRKASLLRSPTGSCSVSSIKSQSFS